MTSYARRTARLFALVGAFAALAGSSVSAEEAKHPVRVFPRVSLFAPLAADPRWPKFLAGYSYYFGDSDIQHVGSAEAGASIAIVQKDARRRGAWEIGLQVGIFAIFDLAGDSTDLLNADYLGGLTFTYAVDSIAVIVRYVHQSSHLGDEYLLNNEVDRINLSFENLDALLSYQVREWARVYGGAGAMVRAEPSSLRRWSLQFGTELRPLSTQTTHKLELLLGLNLRLWQETGWVPDASVIAGITLDPIGESSYRVDFLLRYYIGRSPNGQFFTERIQALGPAIQLYF